MTVTFKLLGTGNGPGVPSFFCNCVACREARAKPHLSRTRSGALIDTGRQRILIDASPDLQRQLVREQIASFDYLFITHWHYDHFGGLGELEYYVQLHRHSPVTLFLPPESLASFSAAYPYLPELLEVQPWQFHQSYRFDHLVLTPLPACHSIQTAGFLLAAEKKIAYFTDTARLPAVTAQRIAGVDYFICDASFYGDNWFPESHLSVAEAIDLGQTIGAQQIILTHLSMHYSTPVTVEELEQAIRAHGKVALAYDGMTLDI